MVIEEIAFEHGLGHMIDEGYTSEQILDPWIAWIERGDVILIFQNADLGHPMVGVSITMPWEADKELPPHAPDSPAIGLGWRYVLRYVIRSR